MLLRGASAALALALIGACPARASAADSSAARVAELRRTFTLDGKPVPPEVFRDFGDGNLADSRDIWVTVDLEAAIGSNLYFDPIAKRGAWLSQTKPGNGPDSGVSAYKYIGATANGLLVVLSAWNGGGSGDFFSLHILDLSPARGIDLDGKPYQRLDLTNLRTVALGDRWDGEIHIAGNALTIVTTRAGPTDDGGKRRTTRIEAARP